MSKVTEHPDDTMPAGKPLDSDTIVEEGDEDASNSETATETINREEAHQPGGGLSPEYDEPDPEEDPPGIEESNTLTSP